MIYCMPPLMPTPNWPDGGRRVVVKVEANWARRTLPVMRQ